ncbi:MAG: hypothetical protein FJZ86_16790 [Chloroflexi bacterium]|nr:hypothetical protein [Chloroflexota bacterium]
MKGSLIFSIIFSILIITACSAPHSSEVTVTRFAKVTVTLPSPTETPTPLPTPFPESLLPQEVQEKFDQAEIALKDMTNAKYDKEGSSFGGITMQRDLTDDSTTPAEFFEFAPDQIMLFHEQLKFKRA